MSLHDWLGSHQADFKASRWDGGYFVSRCSICGKAMVKLPGLPWKLRTSRAA